MAANNGEGDAVILGGVDFVNFRYDKRIAEAPDESGTVIELAGLDERSMIEIERFKALNQVPGEFERRMQIAADKMAKLTVGDVLGLSA